MPDPFLTVLTRCYKRPLMLRENMDSLARQTDRDYEQILIVDDTGRGIGWSFANLKNYADQIRGLYVFLLDDDDMIKTPDFIAELKAFAYQYDMPDVIMMRMEHQPGWILPDRDHWLMQPTMNHIGCSAYAVRRNVWRAHVAEFRPIYQGDFTFIDAVYHSGVRVAWLDRVMTRTQQGHNHGQPENVAAVA